MYICIYTYVYIYIYTQLHTYIYLQENWWLSYAKIMTRVGFITKKQPAFARTTQVTKVSVDLYSPMLYAWCMWTSGV